MPVPGVSMPRSAGLPSTLVLQQQPPKLCATHPSWALGNCFTDITPRRGTTRPPLTQHHVGSKRVLHPTGEQQPTTSCKNGCQPLIPSHRAQRTAMAGRLDTPADHMHNLVPALSAVMARHRHHTHPSPKPIMAWGRQTVSDAGRPITGTRALKRGSCRLPQPI